MAEGIRTRSSEEKEEALVCRIIEKILHSDKFLDKFISNIRTSLENFFDTKTKVLEEKVVQLEAQMAVLSKENEALEQYSRRNSLRIYGIPKTKTENTDEIVMDLCKNKLNINVSSSVIDSSHRLPGKEGAHPPLIVKFVSRNIKNLIFANKKKLKGSSVIIKEDLTRKRAQLYVSACSRYGSKFVWTRDGNIFVKSNNSIKLIKSNNDLITDIV